MQPKYSILGCSIDQILTSHINELRPCCLWKLLLIIIEKNHLDNLVRHQYLDAPPEPALGFVPAQEPRARVLYCQMGKVKIRVNPEFPVSCPGQTWHSQDRKMGLSPCLAPVGLRPAGSGGRLPGPAAKERMVKWLWQNYSDKSSV